MVAPSMTAPRELGTCSHNAWIAITKVVGRFAIIRERQRRRTVPSRLIPSTDCSKWLADCVGFGEATAIRSGSHIYIVAEAMNRSLLCQEDQTWGFTLLRSKDEEWPISGREKWELFWKNPLLRPSKPDAKTLCQVAYARWLVDGNETYLIYEDWAPQHKQLHRRLLKLFKGAGSALTIRDPLAHLANPQIR